VRWKAAVTAVLLASLAFPAAAMASNGGVAPPEPVTPSGEAIRDVYWVVLAVSAVVLVLVETSLIVFIVRFRRRRTAHVEAEGPQIHGNTRLEVAWTAAPAIVLAGLAIFALLKVNDVQANPPSSENALEVKVEAHQFYWQYEYPNGAVSLDTLYVPVDRTTSIRLESADVIHSWWTPELTGKLDVVPGRTNVLNFEPRTTGTYEGTCAEHCGIQHAVMQTTVRVVSQEEFERWLDENSPENADPVALGREEWEAVCAKCHLADGSGLVGPAVQGNGTMLELASLRNLLLTGQDTPQLDSYMPAVGTGWQDRQFDALLAYLESNEQLSTPPVQGQQGAGGATGGS
jgi:cytochrome c oxidase subunit II